MGTVKRTTYPSGLRKLQWKLMKPHFKSMLNRKWDNSELINAAPYYEKTDYQWNLLSNDFPSFSTVWSFYGQAKSSELRERILRGDVKDI